NDTSLPQWRQDLNEKVRAIRARRNNPALAGVAPAKVEEPAAATAPPHHEIREPRRAINESAATLHERHPHVEGFAHETTTATVTAAHANPIVEKALSRVRRASENARREYLPKIEPAKPVRPAFTVENQATARALEPTAEIMQKELPLPEPPPKPIESRVKPSPLAVEAAKTTQPLEPVAAAMPARIVEPLPLAEPVHSIGGDDFDLDDIACAVTIDEIEPVDYLEAEIRKVDRALTAELHRDERLSPLTQLITGVVDIAVIALSALPFLALIGLYNGDFALPQTRYAGIAITLMIAFFYLALTQSLCSRTFGMMLTNTRLIDDLTAEQISAARAILRTVGCMISAVPAGIGLLWGAFSPQRRG